ncbi:MAG: sulfatase-like hydrolase/transferase [Spirochaetes bacterium]|nr:sulfatase-like hydrolase/transferase [Spirochaetota bacterium]
MKRIIALCAALLIVAMLWLFWPLADKRLAITIDERMRARRNDYLSGLTHRTGPNIVIIVADDLSVYDVSRYGGTNVPTPNIDAIGAEGVTFTSAYCTSPICAPSRSALLTGRYHQRSGFEFQPMTRYAKNRLEYYVYKNFIVDRAGDWQIAPLGPVPPESELVKQGMAVEEITLPEILSHSGYVTGITGKWHLGFGNERIPNARGFIEQYGFYEAFSLYTPVHDTNIVESRHRYFSDKHIWAQGRTGLCAIRRNDAVVDEKEYLTFAVAREANAFITSNAAAKRPFMLYVPFNAPHTPFQVPRSYYEKFPRVNDHNRRVYYAMIAALDDAVGSIMKTIRTNGLDENTLIFFASDNGAATYAGVDNFPLKFGKFTFFEGGIRVPFMMRWKGKVPAARVHTPVSLMDVFITAAQAAGVTLPTDRVYDGKDLMTLNRDVERPLFWRTLYVKAARVGTWKLMVDERAKRSYLFDIVADPGELNDLSADHPRVVSDITARLAEWEKGLVPPRWPRVMDFRYYNEGVAHYFPL